MAEIDDFLAGKASAEPAPEQQPEPQAAAPEQEAPPEGEAPPEAEPEGEQEPQQQTRDGRTVPLAVMEKVRNDWKEKSIRAEEAEKAARAEAAELKRQLEEFKRQAEQARHAPQQQMIHQVPLDQLPPMTPEQIAVHQNANFSELVLRQKIGDEEVDQLIKEAEAEIHKDPTLAHQLARQKYPYQWLHSHMQKLKAQREIGEDPVAFRARVAAEERAKLEAEFAQQQQQPQQPRVSPAAGMAPSLANVRSAAPRSAPSFSGPPSLNDVLGR